jgi:putative redox protein
MKLQLKWLEDMTLVGKGDSNHWVTMDASTEVGGTDAGSRPLEFFLMGLGGCTTMDVLSILKKKRSPIEDYELQIEADRAEEHPKVFTQVRLKFIFYGKGIKKQDVERAIELSETKYCSASAMLKKATDIVVEYEIREEK